MKQRGTDPVYETVSELMDAVSYLYSNVIDDGFQRAVTHAAAAAVAALYQFDRQADRVPGCWVNTGTDAISLFVGADGSVLELPKYGKPRIYLNADEFEAGLRPGDFSFADGYAMPNNHPDAAFAWADAMEVAFRIVTKNGA
ncbi:MAG: hypothetical protein KatS3mg082_3369 [Nitrospiraceae bacterium]|nr:MAG: hypothetical protein KatS3mg051_1834 [Anaerolineae bacterium]GIW56965.1 MAG: hypothetical protein KatS3mg082_3369 [Nitrospiraceae bacterium]